jgi:dCMP deaminase
MKEKNDLKYINPKWVKRFLSLAEEISTWSHDPSTKVGAVLVNCHGRITATGYNGLPVGFDDSKMTDREYKIPRVIHAELNCIANRNMSINEDCYLFVTHPMCVECAKIVAAHSFIKGVAWKFNPEFAAKWNSTASVEFLKEHFMNLNNVDAYDVYSLTKDKIVMIGI